MPQQKQGHSMPACIVNGCQNHASNNFGVRLRREDTSAIWAPNTEAYICDVHASSGFDIVVQLHTRTDNNIVTHVSANGGTVAQRLTPITNTP